jgi:hypothetical protein
LYPYSLVITRNAKVATIEQSPNGISDFDTNYGRSGMRRTKFKNNSLGFGVFYKAPCCEGWEVSPPT